MKWNQLSWRLSCGPHGAYWRHARLELTPQGILVRCQCEKQKACPADGYYHRPLPAFAIQDQIEKLLLRLQKEYLVPTKKLYYATIYGGRESRRKALVLPALWFDPQRFPKRYVALTVWWTNNLRTTRRDAT